MTPCIDSIPAIKSASHRLARRAEDKQDLLELSSLLADSGLDHWKITQAYFAWIRAIKLFRSFEDEQRPPRTSEDFRSMIRALIAVGEFIQSLIAASDGFPNKTAMLEEIQYALIPLADTEQHYYLAENPEQTRSLLDIIMSS